MEAIIFFKYMLDKGNEAIRSLHAYNSPMVGTLEAYGEYTHLESSFHNFICDIGYDISK